MGLPGGISSALVKSLAVVAICFAGTLSAIHLLRAFWGQTQAPIHVVDATYGGNCRDSVTPAQRPNLVKSGNATAVVSAACDGLKSPCLFKIDVTMLGDPAAGCGKEFVVTWRCGDDQRAHESYFPAEADHRIALISCRRW
jgi:hypothetical protein